MGIEKVCETQQGHFVYTHSDLYDDDLLDKILLPAGMTLCRRVEKEEKRRAYKDVRWYSQEELRLDAFFKTVEERFQPVRVVILDFHIPEPARTILRDAEDPMVNVLLGRYLGQA